MKKGVEARGSVPMPMEEGMEVSKDAYSDEAEPMRGFIVIEPDTGMDRWLFSIFVKVCLM